MEQEKTVGSQIQEESNDPVVHKRVFSLPKALALLALAVLVTLAVIGIWLGMIKFKPARGLAGSEFIGLTNIQRFLQSPYVLRLSRNTLVSWLVQALAGFAAAAPLLLWIKASHNAGRALTKTCVCLIPACLPTVGLFYLLLKLPHPQSMFVDVNYYYGVYAAMTVFQTAGFIAFCGGLFEYLGKRGIGGGMRWGLSAAALILALRLLTPNKDATLFAYNPMVYEAADTLDTYVYRTGLQNADYSFSSAVQSLKAIVQALLGILPASMLVKLSRKDETRITIPDQKGSVSTWLFAIVVWLVIMVAASGYIFGLDRLMDQPEASAEAFITATGNATVLGSMAITAITAAFSGVFAGTVAYGFVQLNRTNQKGFSAAVIVWVSAGSFLMAEYIAVRNLGILNTLMPQVVLSVFEPQIICITIALTAALRMAPERQTRGLTAGLMFIGSALSWGSYFNNMIYVRDRSLYSLSLLLRELLIGASSGSGEITSQAELLARDAMTPTVALLVILPAILLSAAGALCLVSAFRKEE